MYNLWDKKTKKYLTKIAYKLGGIKWKILSNVSFIQEGEDSNLL